MKIYNKYSTLFSILLVLLMGSMSYGADFSGQVLVGYTGGPGFQVNLVTSNFAKDFPLNLQFGVGYASRNPGNAADARKIFINDATRKNLFPHHLMNYIRKNGVL